MGVFLKRALMERSIRARIICKSKVVCGEHIQIILNIFCLGKDLRKGGYGDKDLNLTFTHKQNWFLGLTVQS